MHICIPRIMASKLYNKQKSLSIKKSIPQQQQLTSNIDNIKPPNWPALKPLIPPSDLHLETLLEDQILIIRNLLAASLCRTYVSFLSTLPLITTPKGPKKDEAVRVNDRFQVHDAAFAERLWSGTALNELVLAEGEGEALWGGEVLGLNPNIRIYRYAPGQFFDKHYDDSVPLLLTPSTPSTTPTPTIPAKTTWTLLIYLTTCTGGETVFYPDDDDDEQQAGPPKSKSKSKSKSSPQQRQQQQQEPIIVSLETGMALLHRHGERCLLHEGREVVAGEKWVIRSDLVVRR
ncbi:hypothetical protein BDDG_03485 [Blastomyces dermatitidis ATCC 18188]|uniref:Fe2OG dioxygenase domain-containing protein n=1 Tax=Ajellomyces dermatitidis (strain ATCC 18188 / CBS 674.68) TaxID=653446 RepID=F2TBF7_AJEDA|nr:hypothetical protein BDDG_03485 [Blastomyces dermatitidis ATCC 18188]